MAISHSNINLCGYAWLLVLAFMQPNMKITLPASDIALTQSEVTMDTVSMVTRTRRERIYVSPDFFEKTSEQT